MRSGVIVICMVILVIGIFQVSPCFSAIWDMSNGQARQLSSRGPGQERGRTLTHAMIDQFVAGAHNLKAKINSPDYAIKLYDYDMQNADSLMPPYIGIIDLTVISKYLDHDVVFQFYYTFRGEKWTVVKFSAVVDNTKVNQFERLTKSNDDRSSSIELPKYELINDRIQLPNNVYNKLFVLMCEPF